MGIWIKSQNGQDLAKIDYIFIANDKNYIMGYNNGIKIFLGEYKTYERMLEIIDSIRLKISLGYQVTEMPEE